VLYNSDMTGTAKTKQLKQEYVKYFEDVPVQKYAAMAIARDEDTIIRWRKEDTTFADAVQRAKASWIRKKVIASKAEFALERLENEVFSPKLTVAHEGLDETRNKIRAFLDEVHEDDFVAQ
jgi:hypothetical protein